MHMHTLEALLTRVVERKGFTVQGADPEALFARKGDETLLAAWKTDGPVTAADVQLFGAALEQLHATSGILVAFEGVDASAKDTLTVNKRIDVWAESRLVIEVGEALVKDAVEGHPTTQTAGASPASLPQTPTRAPPQAELSRNAGTKVTGSLIATGAASVGHNSGAAYFMPNKPKKEVPADMQATIGQSRGGSLNYAWGGAAGGSSSAGIAQIRSGRHPSRKADQWGNLIPAGQAQAAPATAKTATTVAPDEDAYEIITTPKKAKATPSGPPAGATNVLRLNVTKEDALAKTQAKVGAIVKLALVPHIAFDYDVRVERPDLEAPITGKGALLVSSLTGELRVIEKLDYATSEPADVARKDQEKLQAVDVYEKVKNHVLKTFSKTLNVEKEIAGNTVMGTVKVAPDPDEMGLQHRGVLYVPVWEITGGGVNAKVDAYTGATN